MEVLGKSAFKPHDVLSYANATLYLMHSLIILLRQTLGIRPSDGFPDELAPQSHTPPEVS